MKEVPKKKILFIITKSNFGGAQRYVFDIATNLPKDSFDVTVAFGGSGLLKEKLEAHGIKTYSIKSFERDINIFKEYKSLFELWTLMHTIRPNIVHLNSSKAGGSGALIARLSRVPRIIFTAHGWPFHEKRSIFWRIAIWFFSWITVLLAHTTILVSEYDKTHSWMPCIKNKITRIYPALSPIDFRSRENARSTLYSKDIQAMHAHDTWVVTTAELTQNKNILTAIQAVSTYNKNNPSQKIFYTVLGDGEHMQTLSAYCVSHNLVHEVFLAGYIPEAKIYLKAFDIFLLPSHKEGTPYALLEAGSAKMPVIASRVGGIPEVITHEVHGILIDSHKPETIVSALRFYTENPTKQKTTGAALVEKIHNVYALDTMLEKTFTIYTS